MTRRSKVAPSRGAGVQVEDDCNKVANQLEEGYKAFKVALLRGADAQGERQQQLMQGERDTTMMTAEQ
jgi:hypothetical protein